jgi:hypothetical protein
VRTNGLLMMVVLRLRLVVHLRGRRVVMTRREAVRPDRDDLPLLPRPQGRAVGHHLVVLLGAHVLAVVRTQRGL